MSRAGHPTTPTAIRIGLHDFEQSHADIFRKVVVHTHKHVRFMAMAARAWQRQAAADPDFRVALVAAAAAGAMAAGAAPPRPRGRIRARIDRRDFPDEIGSLLGPMKLREKPALGIGKVSAADVAQQVSRFGEAPEYLAARKLIEASTKGPGARIVARLRHHGAASPVWLAGTALERSGLWLRRRLDHGDR